MEGKPGNEAGLDVVIALVGLSVSISFKLTFPVCIITKRTAVYTLHQLNYGVCLKIQQLLKFESLHSSVDSRVTLYYLYDSGGKKISCFIR